MATVLAKQRSIRGDNRNSEEATLEQVLARIAALAPMVERLAPDTEQTRRQPTELVNALKSAGIYRMLVPRRYGGLELDPLSAFRAVTALSRLDGSVGWNAGAGQIAALIPFMTSQDVCEQIHRDGDTPIIAGSGQPVGTAERVSGGWRVNGAWPFASGCQNADWLLAACVMMEGGSPIGAQEGSGPVVRGFLMPAERWEIRDTWHTLGLRGTGSHHIALTDELVPDANFFEFPFGTPFAPDPVFSKFPQLLVMAHAPVALGIAEGAIMDLVELAKGGVRQLFMTSPLIETERFKEGLARLDAELMAARALLDAQVTSAWQSPVPAQAKDLAGVAEQLQAAIWVASACVRVVEGCFELAGSRAVYESSLLQRRVRDVRTAAQHFTLQQRQYVMAGAAVLARRS
jgi:indole-3-acetate monooxygenase